MIYKIRWDIEKAFDQAKNRMGEKKAWCKSPIGKTIQIIFVCIAHNLTLLLEDDLDKIHDIRVDRDKKRRRERLKNHLKTPLEKVSSWLFDLQRVTQRPLIL